ncbi:MAG: hypothetical protein CME65_07150 [Halobacteriovoraceae bacterium]|nr:hypothetical protein [Halobacteriovoraceae bacterium]|tara:strand:+ start:4251 stop:4601 length:351 start_codon:yes stop_codon:yes gene_type:complete
MADRIKPFKNFYPFYLSEHSNKTNRALHFTGTSLLLLVLIYALVTGQYKLIWICPLLGYGFAWPGHFVIEKNRPATFKQPIYSLMGDFVMWFHLLTGKLAFDTSKDHAITKSAPKA